MTCQKWSIVQLYCHLKNNPDKYELIIEDDDRAKGLQEYAIFKVLDWQERFILEAIFMARNYNDLYPYLDDVAKKICELSDVSKDFILGSLDFRLYGVRMKIKKLGDGEITEKEWDTYTVDDIEKLVNKYGCPVTGYNMNPGPGEGHSHYEYTVKGAIDNLLKYTYILQEAKNKADPNYNAMGHYDSYEDYGAHNGR